MAAPVLCAGLTSECAAGTLGVVLIAAYKALLNANLKVGDWVVIPGAGGGLGHLAVQVYQPCYPSVHEPF